MDPNAMRRPAKLLIWRTGLDSTGLHEACTYDSLEIAIAAAAGLLGDGDAYPWIVTEAGAMLTPQWIGTHLDANPETRPEPPQRVRASEQGPRPVRSAGRERGWLRFLRARLRRGTPYRLAVVR